jgi:hypothetical protein
MAVLICASPPYHSSAQLGFLPEFPARLESMGAPLLERRQTVSKCILIA